MPVTHVRGRTVCNNVYDLKFEMVLVRVLLIFLALGACVAAPFRRVVNGRNEDPYDPRPSTVWLRKGLKRVHCGGTLVSDSWVVTAASCFNEQINGVIAGNDDVTADEKTKQERMVLRKIPHPDFNATTLENDIGLIQVEMPFELDDEVSPIPLLSSDSPLMEGLDEDDIMSKHCRIAGWGQPSCLKMNQFANPLKELVVDRVNDADCDNKTGDRPSSAVCFHPYRRPELASTCEGDIGGPYICKVRTVWHLVGVISAWRSTGEICTKGIKGATKIMEYVPWIRSHTGEETATPNIIPVEPGLSTMTDAPAPTASVPGSQGTPKLNTPIDPQPSTTKPPVPTPSVPGSQGTPKLTTPIDPLPPSTTKPPVPTPSVPGSQGTPKLTTPIDPLPPSTTKPPVPTPSVPGSQGTPKLTTPIDPLPPSTTKPPVPTPTAPVSQGTPASVDSEDLSSSTTQKPQTTAVKANTSPENVDTNKPATAPGAIVTSSETADTNKPTTTVAANTSPAANSNTSPAANANTSPAANANTSPETVNTNKPTTASAVAPGNINLNHGKGKGNANSATNPDDDEMPGNINLNHGKGKGNANSAANPDDDKIPGNINLNHGKGKGNANSAANPDDDKIMDNFAHPPAAAPWHPADWHPFEWPN